MEPALIIWEKAFLYKVTLFADNHDIFGIINDFVSLKTVVKPVLGLSYSLFSKLSTVTSFPFERFFALSLSTHVLVYSGGLSGGGCLNSKGKHQPMPEKGLIPKVQYIDIENKGLFHTSFAVTSGKYDSDFIESSGTEKNKLDLAGLSFRVGQQLTLVVKKLLESAFTTEYKIEFALNGLTAIYQVDGASIVDYQVIKADYGPAISHDWPVNISVNKVPFSNWDKTIQAKKVWTCAPRDSQEAAAACNWAATHSYQVRPRGTMYSWSPLILGRHQSGVISNVLLMDTTKYLNNIEFSNNGILGPRVTVGAGISMGEMLEFLENPSLGGSSTSPGTGWGFPGYCGTEHITVGGFIATGGRGTASASPFDDPNITYGSFSNYILELKAIVSDASGVYRTKTFKRGEPDTKAFLVSLGRTLITQVTLKVIPNFNLRCQSIMDINKSVLFAPPAADGSNPHNSFAYFLENNGRVASVWFPFTKNPWMRLYKNCSEKPQSSREIKDVDPYEFANNISASTTKFMERIYETPYLTPIFSKATTKLLNFELKKNEVLDIWGSSKDIIFNVSEKTSKIYDFGYGIQLSRSNLQKAINMISEKYNELILEFDSHRKWPMNGPIEFRISSLDSSEYINTENGEDPARPVISSVSADRLSEENGWDICLMIEITTLPISDSLNEFYFLFEEWILYTFTGIFARARPEWSKGAAYTKDGPWTNQAVLRYIRESFTTGRTSDDDWQWETETLEKYDSKNIFQSAMTQQLFIKS